MTGFGIFELLFIALILLLLVGVPIVIVLLVLVFSKRSDAAKHDKNIH